MWEVQLELPEVKVFNHDVLLLIVPDSAHMQYTPITLGKLHIDMAIKLATKKNLRISTSKGKETCLL